MKPTVKAVNRKRPRSLFWDDKKELLAPSIQRGQRTLRRSNANRKLALRYGQIASWYNYKKGK